MAESRWQPAPPPPSGPPVCEVFLGNEFLLPVPRVLAPPWAGQLLAPEAVEPVLRSSRGEAGSEVRETGWPERGAAGTVVRFGEPWGAVGVATNVGPDPQVPRVSSDSKEPLPCNTAADQSLRRQATRRSPKPLHPP